MSGVAKSAGGFLGLSGGPQAPQGQFGNNGLSNLQNNSNFMFSNDPTLRAAQDRLYDYGLGQGSADSVLSDRGIAAGDKSALADELATNPLTGSRYATEQVQNNGILGGLFGKGGQLDQAEGKLTDLNNQGFNLKPEDQTLYGQEAGNIARQFASQSNQTAANLASRGLSNSGAAGAAFSGLAGNQNEMLAQAQQQIAQQRFQNTMNQIQQQQNFVSQLGNQGANAINQQYGRQLAGAQNHKAGLESAAGLQNSANQAQNNYGLQKSMFDTENTPANFMDFANAGMGSLTQAAAGGAAANNMNNAYKVAAAKAGAG